MCTYVTQKVAIEGSGKGAQGWFALTARHRLRRPPGPRARRAHPQHRLPGTRQGPSARVAVELTEEAALALVEAITQALAAAPPGFASRDQ